MARKRDDSPGGIVVIDKPSGMTSHDVVSRVRRLAGTRRVGHGGTLDPMATGVLVVATGKATRLLTYLLGSPKSYRGTIRLGAATTTDDAEGEAVSTADASALPEEAIHDGLAALTGEIQQVPSTVSAIKVDGRRAHERVRAGEDVELKARTITVYSIEVESIARDGAFVDVTADFTVSSGTYIRAIARDLGAALGVGGHLTMLRRTSVGDFRVEDAAHLDALVESGEVPITPLADAARQILPSVDLGEREATALSYGQAIDGAVDGPTAAIGPDGRLMAVVVEKKGRLSPDIVFEPAGA